MFCKRRFHKRHEASFLGFNGCAPAAYYLHVLDKLNRYYFALVGL